MSLLTLFNRAQSPQKAANQAYDLKLLSELQPGQMSSMLGIYEKQLKRCDKAINVAMKITASGFGTVFLAAVTDMTTLGFAGALIGFPALVKMGYEIVKNNKIEDKHVDLMTVSTRKMIKEIENRISEAGISPQNYNNFPRK